MALRFLRRDFSPSLAVAALCLACAMSSDAFGQTNNSPNAQPADTPSEAETGPRGEHMPRNITYSGWRKICFKDSLAQVVCRTSTSGAWDTGQTAVRVDLIERQGDNAKRLQIFLPVGLYLQAGVKLTIDDRTSARIPYSWCLTNICVAGNLVEPSFLQAMEAAQKLTLEVVDSNLLTVPNAVPLDQFSAVHRGAPTETFELPADDN